MVWPHLKILWHGEDNSAGDSERSKKRRRGRQTKRWEDNIKELTGIEFGDTMGQGQWKTGEGGKVLLQRHLWCPDYSKVK